MLNIAMECQYGTVDLMDDTHHLFTSHGFLTNDKSYKEIRQFMIDSKTIGRCTAKNEKECISMIRHCRKDRRPGGVCNAMLNEIASEHDILKETWIGILDKIHCPLFHDKSTDFRRTFQRINNDKEYN